MKLRKIALGLLVLLVVGVLVLGLLVDDLAKSAIQDGGTRALGVATTLDSADVGLFRGTFGLKKLAVANPQGFGPSRFLELGDGKVEVSALSLLSDKVEVPELSLSGIRLNLVQGLRGSNYGRILDNLKRFQGRTEPDEGAGKRFVIDKLVISDVLVTVEPVPELKLEKLELPVDRIELRGVGSDRDNRGVLVSELTGIVVEAVLARASASGGLPPMVQNALSGRLAGLSGLRAAGATALGDALKGSGLPEGVQKRVDDAAKSLLERLGGGK